MVSELEQAQDSREALLAGASALRARLHDEELSVERTGCHLCRGMQRDELERAWRNVYTLERLARPEGASS